MMAKIIERRISINFSQDQMNTVILNPIFQDEDFKMIFNVDQNARTKTKLPFMTYSQNLLRPQSGCKIETVKGVKVGQREFDIDDQAFRMELCGDEFFDTIWQGAKNRGVMKKDLTNTEIISILVDCAQVGISKDLQNTAFFSKKSMSIIPGAEYLRVANGLWSYYFPKLQDEGKLSFVPFNSALNAPGDATNLLKAVYENQTNVMKAAPRNLKMILVDDNTYDKYMGDLESTQANGGLTNYVENGKDMLAYRGVRVIPMYEWITVLVSLGIDVSKTPPNFAMMVTSNNLWFGTDSTDPQQELRTWYEKKDRTNYLDCEFNIGFNYFHHEYFSVAGNQTVIDALKAL